jgi:hypothetical protein
LRGGLSLPASRLPLLMFLLMRIVMNCASEVFGCAGCHVSALQKKRDKGVYTVVRCPGHYC